MQTNNKRSIMTIGLISFGIIIISMFGFWIWENTRYFSHNMFQNHNSMYFGSSLWGIFLIIIVFIMILIGLFSMIKNKTEQNTNEIPECSKCGEELLNPLWEFCPSCGEPTGENVA
jgi:hypothetical protein